MDKLQSYLLLCLMIQSKKIENYQDMFAQLPEHVYLKDPYGVYLWCNNNQARDLNLNGCDELIGKTDYDLSSKILADQFYSVDQRVINECKEIEVEEKILTNGIPKVTLTKKIPILNKNNQVTGLLGISCDITARKKMEQDLRQANQALVHSAAAMAKSEAEKAAANAKATSEEEMRKTVMVLVGDIVHDLRTPIATIRTIASLLSTLLPPALAIIDEAKTLGAKTVDTLSKKELNALFDGTILHSLQSAVSMMDNFINTTLSELGTAQKAQDTPLTSDDLTRCSSRRILENTLDAYPFNPGIIVHQDTAYDFYLMGNSILIMKILFNLIRNAIDQIALHKKGEITITTGSTAKMNLIKVKDTAGGASPEVVDNFFKGYFTTKKHGTGIGLAYCKETMRIFGGDLTCENVEGDYIEFILAFPKIDDQANSLR